MGISHGIPAAAADRGRDVHGAKLVIFFGDRLPVIKRDDRDDIPDPGRLDLPGGGCEPGESALDCVLRETLEELSLCLAPGDLHYARAYRHRNGREVWFFAAHLDDARLGDIRLGDEGQFWQLIGVEQYLCHPDAIADFQARLADYVAGV